MKEGGTAVDAAISALACNGAVHSHSMGLGGGFLMTIFKKFEEKAYFLNARETAPRYSTEHMFVNTTLSPQRGIFYSYMFISSTHSRKWLNIIYCDLVIC